MDENKAEDNLYQHVTELMVALDVACVLTFAFLDRLDWIGKTSLCLFSVAIPILAGACFAITVTAIIWLRFDKFHFKINKNRTGRLPPSGDAT
jgi:hypothetical protein